MILKKILRIFFFTAFFVSFAGSFIPNRFYKNAKKNQEPVITTLAPNYQHAYQGNSAPLRILMSNSSTIGKLAWTQTGSSVPAETLGMEYPNGSGIEHIYGGGLWIAGKIDTTSAQIGQYVTAVTTGYEGNSALKEMYPGSSTLDKIWIVQEDVKPPDWDSYWGSQLPFKKVSDEDFYCRYRDFNFGLNVANHLPLNVEVVQKSFSWMNDYAGAIVPIDLTIYNKSTRLIKDAYVGYFIDTDIGIPTETGFYNRNFSGYVNNLRLAYAHNPITRGATPIGCVYISSPKVTNNVRFTYEWFDFSSGTPYNDDASRYNLMARGTQRGNQSPEISQLSDTRFLFSFGPYDIQPDSSLNIVVAILSGEDLQELKENAARAVEIYRLGYKLPYIPPSPKLTSEIGFKKISLRWDNSPEKAWDDSNHIAEQDSNRHPSDSSHRRGGFVFEGYRIYRSLEPSVSNPPIESFSLLRQVDVDDQFEFNTGLEYSYEDTNLVRGNTYWYAVTTLAIPNEFLQIQPDSAGNLDTFVVSSKAAESSIRENWTRVVLPFDVAKKKNEVMVVPNPYRVDYDYTFENGGWEGRNKDWSEDRRLIRFIHVPKKCTIKIYTLAGDLVETLEHNDPMRGEVDWNLLSRGNRAIASGIYIFSVESDEFDTQVGKFVIIR
ncbi:MAG: hypothetical protein FJ218_03785 [Ignavibacteria bacterium]|nr:hypothetical protein [Ignavibacteria bacterium]